LEARGGAKYTDSIIAYSDATSIAPERLRADSVDGRFFLFAWSGPSVRGIQLFVDGSAVLV